MPAMKVLGVGIATLDIVNTLATYPLEDSESRILEQDIRRGGNASNTLVTLSQLGHYCEWAGVLANEPHAGIILRDLETYSVGSTYCEHLGKGKMPVSYIILNRTNGSRTITHYRDLPEFSYDAFMRIPHREFDWIHFEGRNIQETRLMLEAVRQDVPVPRISLEVEKDRAEMASLFDLPGVLLFSKHYANAKGYTRAGDFLSAMQALAPQAFVSCAWGGGGAYALMQGELLHHPAWKPQSVVDTLGAGDVFNGAMIHALGKGEKVTDALAFACRLAGQKCAYKGFQNLGRVNDSVA